MDDILLNLNFEDYYYKYLGINKEKLKYGKTVFSCEQRSKPLNGKFMQYLISTYIEGKLVFSVAPKYHEELCDLINGQPIVNESSIIEILNAFFNNKLSHFNLRKMHRLTLNEEYDIQNLQDSSVMKLTKEIFMDNLEGMNEFEKAQIYEKKKDEIIEGRKFIVLSDRKIVSMCKISDINFSGGNIVVWTDSNYRNKGFGKQVLAEGVKWCINNKIIPIYWVDSQNTASINLADSLGFKTKSEEIVVSLNL